MQMNVLQHYCRSRGSSKYTGVSWNKEKNRWEANISINNGQRRLGYFKDEIEAAKVYDEKLRKYVGEGNIRLNFPLEKDFCFEDENFSEFLDGNLLGDGSLTSLSSLGVPAYSHASKHKELLEYYSILFEKQRLKGTIHLRKNHFSVAWGFGTRSDLRLLSFRKRWYPNKKKIVPRDLKLTPTVLFWWYIGDGNLKNTKDFTSRICFATDGFSFNNVEFLQKQMKHLGLVTYICKSVKNQPVLYLKTKSTQKFFDYIALLPKELENIYGYKWNYQICPRKRGGRKRWGENHPNAKLIEEDVIEILKDNRSIAQIAKSYNLGKTTVGHIKRRETWKHVEI